ncbi:hypothetical protein HMPREF0549_0555, partial [Limosilactobacillus vaginalis DSM 5837 = ATCC 49540]
TPRALSEAMIAGGDEAKRAFEAMMSMKKIDIATIEAARRGDELWGWGVRRVSFGKRDATPSPLRGGQAELGSVRTLAAL